MTLSAVKFRRILKRVQCATISVAIQKLLFDSGQNSVQEKYFYKEISPNINKDSLTLVFVLNLVKLIVWSDSNVENLSPNLVII